MNRGARRAPVFDTPMDCERFIGLLRELPERFGVRVHGYALMPNHFHLMLSCPRGGLPHAMQYLQSRYSRHVNDVGGRDGPVWRGRYRNRLVETEEYWRHLLTYLHLNPSRAGLEEAPGTWAWTSHASYVGRRSNRDWVETDELRRLYGSPKAYQAYLVDQLAGDGAPPSSFDAEALWGSTTSGDADRLLGPQRVLGLEQAWQELTHVTGLSRAELLAAPRGRRGNPARWVAFWWLSVSTRETQAAIGRLAGAKPPVVSAALRRVRAEAGTPGQEPWKAWVRTLSGALRSGGRPEREREHHA